MLRDTLPCRRAISGVSRKVWRHTKFTLDKIDLASEPKKKRHGYVYKLSKNGVQSGIQNATKVCSFSKKKGHEAVAS